MGAKDRLDQIRRELNEVGQVSVGDLSRRLGVTEETIRRDLERLESEGVLKRTYGGAILNPAQQAQSDTQFDKRVSRSAEEKRVIALKVLPLVENVSTIAIDSSTTAVESVKQLANREDMTLLTNSVAALRVLETGSLHVVLTGGEFNRETLSLRGDAAKRALDQYHIDTLLFSCKGIDSGGTYDTRPEEVEMKQRLMERSGRLILLADHTKFGKTAFVKLASLDAISCIVTDRKPDDKWCNVMREHDIRLVF
jgi:DeoR/GlpR family transcriptional regulator of sugar metabolism